MTFHTHHGMSQGFTLVEIIIYTGILSFIVVGLLSLADVMRTSRQRLIVTNRTHTAASRILNTVNALVRNADGFVADSGGTKCVFGNKLWLYYATSSVQYLPTGCMGEYATG